MLDLKKISSLKPYSDAWWNSRLGKLTGSKISCICDPKGIGTGGMSYIRNKVYEKITRKSSERNVTTEATTWGITNEPISISEYQNKYQIPVIVTEKHLVENEYFSVTPDGLIILRDFGDSYECETLESKSYQTPAEHLKHCECETADAIKAVNTSLYWQVISQMYAADTLRGNAIFFHPDFPVGSPARLHRVVFKKIELLKDFTLFKSRLAEAEKLFIEKYNKFKVAA